jgi:hypothetical protein
MLNASQVRIIDPILTTVALGYVQPDLIGGRVFPRVPVEISGGQVIQFGKEGFMKYNLRRAPGGATKRIEFGYLGTHFALVQDAIEAKVPREWMRDASVMPGIDLGSRAVRLGMKVVLLSLEVEQATAALNAANYDGAHQIALAGAAKWSNAASDPVAQIDAGREAIRATTGVYPNLLSLSPVAFSALRNNPSIKDRFKFTSATSITTDMLATLLEVPEVIVGKGITSDDAGNFTDIWGNNALLSYSPKNPEGAEEPSFAYTYTMNCHPLVEVPYWESTTKSWIYPTTMERAPVITAPTAGYLIQTPN